MAFVSQPKQNSCHCPPLCELHESSPHDKVQVYKSNADRGKILCVAYQPIRWTFGSNFKQVPQMQHGELQLHRSTIRRANGQKVCLSLTVIPQLPSWNTSTLFVRCETNATSEASSRWYKLKEKWEFEGQDFRFDPQVTWNPKKPTDEAVKTTEETFMSHTIPVKPFDDTTHGPTANLPTSAKPITQQSTAHQPSSVPLTTVVAAAAGAAAFLILLLVLVVILFKKVKEQRNEIEMTNEEIDEFMLGVTAEKANAKGINGLFILPYDTKLEIPKSGVIFRSKILGSGAFGQVVKGEYHGGPVAIKMLKNNGSQSAEYLRSLLGELKVMSYLGSHPNLVGLVGAITKDIKKGEAYLIFEYCSNGNAHKYVRNHRDSFVDLLACKPRCASVLPTPVVTTRTKSQQPNSSVTKIWKHRFSNPSGTTTQGVPLTTKDLLRWAYEIASGMEYVSAKNVYHGDLAARNILLTTDLTAKVGDFGLSKQLDMEEYNCYVQKKECPLPLKWMAIESLRDLTFSIQSDIWSYGVTLWELFTLGATPYPGMDWNFESWKFLCEGKRLGKPDYASGSLYNIMMKCWDVDSRLRPGFAQLKETMSRELKKF